jgi:hypothetical protein
LARFFIAEATINRGAARPYRVRLVLRIHIGPATDDLARAVFGIPAILQHVAAGFGRVGSFHIRKVCPLLLAAHPQLAHAAEEETLQTTTTNAKNNRMPEPPFLLETLQSNQAGRSKSNLVWIEPGDTHSTASQRTPRALAFGPSRSRLAYCSGWNGNGIGVLLASNHRRS